MKMAMFKKYEAEEEELPKEVTRGEMPTEDVAERKEHVDYQEPPWMEQVAEPVWCCGTCEYYRAASVDRKIGVCWLFKFPDKSWGCCKEQEWGPREKWILPNGKR